MSQNKPVNQPISLTLDPKAGLALLHSHEGILDLEQLSGPAESSQREAVCRVTHGFVVLSVAPANPRGTARQAAVRSTTQQCCGVVERRCSAMLCNGVQFSGQEGEVTGRTREVCFFETCFSSRVPW